LLFFSNSFIVDEFIRLWEIPITKDTGLQNKSFDAGIVLGGGMITKDVENNRMIFRNNVDRILQAVYLYDKKIIKKIIISSGSGSLVYRNMLEASLLKQYLVNSIKIPSDDIIIDSLSDNTHENAIHTSKIINTYFKNGNFLLITSAIHMRRALGCFKKQDINVMPYSTDKITGKRRWDILYLISPNIQAIVKWQNLIHEVIGYYIYRLMGYI